MKFAAFYHDITQRHVLRKCRAHVRVVEWQKHGLPHCHCLLWFDQDQKLRGPEEYDTLVCAELPHPIKQPRLFKSVTGHMIHGPCKTDSKAPCRKGPNKTVVECLKNFPKDFQDETEEVDGYPLYRRRPPVVRDVAPPRAQAHAGPADALADAPNTFLSRCLTRRAILLDTLWTIAGWSHTTLAFCYGTTAT
eukprot:363160-Chlamydomonas_euryale.AAC.1